MKDSAAPLVSLINTDHPDLMMAIRDQFIISITDSRGVIIDVNDAFCDISQYSRDELLGQNHRIINSGVHPKSFFSGMWKTISKGKSWRGEICNASKDGNHYWVDSVITALRDKHGKIEQYLSIRIDITTRKKQEHDLKMSQSLLDKTGQIAGIGGWEIDLETSQLYWSSQTRKIHGVDSDYQPKLAQAIEFYAPEARPFIKEAVEHAIKTGEGWDLELPFIKATGERIWVKASGSVEFLDTKPVRLIGAFQDITNFRALTDELEKQRELLQVTLDSIGDAVITTDKHGRVKWLNPVAQRLTGWRSLEAQGKALSDVFNIVDKTTRQKIENPVQRCLNNKTLTALTKQPVLIAKSGEEYGIENSASPIQGKDNSTLRMVLVFRDVTEQRNLTETMNYQASHDSLTGLINRAEFDRQLSGLLKHYPRQELTHALLYIDLDQFKIINDSCGHTIGDEALKKVSKFLAKIVTAPNILARLGGDEFGVILLNSNQAQASAIAQKICDGMEVFRFFHEEYRFRIGASVGLVMMDKTWESPASILQAADKSCYAAKDAGRNRVHLYSDSDQTMLDRQGEMQWTTRIEKALDEDDFVLFGQQLINTKKAHSGMHIEILLRMLGPNGQIIPPGAFFPSAERFQLAPRIDKWVLKHTVLWLKAFKKEQLEQISMICINLSGQSIVDPEFQAYAKDILSNIALQLRQKLCIEITETAAITNLNDASSFVEQLKKMGAIVALDDFGAGASSFGYLKQLNVDILKIDGQFIQNLLTEPLDEAAVKCFVDVANIVGLQTVAEFVDQPEILKRVKALGIDFAQGFLLHKPEPLASILAMPSMASSPSITSSPSMSSEPFTQQKASGN